MEKKFWESKTFWLACAQALSGVVVVFATAYPMLGWLIVLKSIVDVALRFVSSTKVTL